MTDGRWRMVDGGWWMAGEWRYTRACLRIYIRSSKAVVEDDEAGVIRGGGEVHRCLTVI